MNDEINLMTFCISSAKFKKGEKKVETFTRFLVLFLILVVAVVTGNFVWWLLTHIRKWR
ncbi:MAG: hypothetical protein LBR09_01290 [Endomicrobium sp.]|nr:hypothetical protein [Endomicrobium sp.]